MASLWDVANYISVSEPKDPEQEQLGLDISPQPPGYVDPTRPSMENRTEMLPMDISPPMPTQGQPAPGAPPSPNGLGTQGDGASIEWAQNPLQQRGQAVIQEIMRHLDMLDDAVDSTPENKASLRLDSPVLFHVMKSRGLDNLMAQGAQREAEAYSAFIDALNDGIGPDAVTGTSFYNAGEFVVGLDAQEVMHFGDTLSNALREGRNLFATELGNRAKDVEKRYNIPPRWEALWAEYEDASLQHDQELLARDSQSSAGPPNSGPAGMGPISG